MSTAHTITLPVRFAETDAMGVVHHSNHIIWFEAARVAWLDAAGIPYTEVAAGGHHFAVTGATVEYRKAAYFGDTVAVTADLTLLRSRQVQFRYEVHHAGTGALLARGHTEHVCVDLEGRMASIPQATLERLRRATGAPAQEQDSLHP